ncbi:helix-turn-helix domain-containing protein [Actinomadura madurae]|uniref:Zn-dependent peptidase ImmA, M78 family n=1 Tax=Actinomadura madurae TaxID=1993 RepID=A0A1I5DDX8_9ACTN|nr:XRE family transcriptional regulator [Actinomadura madurae]SFN97435.1 Zn-dependent peptidase ImmA, M78 family [Actinomadura madurae]SPT50372.1 anaerobic benzoate catabolism transcriptional regulator [Actinomadura madurae]
MTNERGWREVGARVAEARSELGLSQDALATEIGLDRTAVTKIEAGRRQISSLELVRLAEALDRPLQWFVLSPPTAVVSRRAALEGRRSDPKCDQMLDALARDVAVLARVHVLAPDDARGSLSAIAPGAATWHVEKAASNARALLGVDAGSPLHDLADTAERVGLYPYSVALGAEGGDGAYVEIEGIGVALINGNLDAGRRRSTLAHELGHHLFGDQYSIDWGADTSTTERAIDAFAANLLLPRVGCGERWRALRKEHDLRPAAIILSAEYRTSWTATLRQLKTFDLITRDEYRTLDSRSPTRADYLECGMRVTEELTPLYIPTGIAAAAIRAYRTHRLSAERVTEMLRGQIDIDDLPARDEIPLEALRGELR